MNYLVNALTNIKNEELISFHVPGHKNGKLYKKLGMTNFLKNIVSIDTTEISGTDNLHAPNDVIKKSLEYAKNVFKSDKTFFLVNGSTCGIETAIMSICKPNEKIIINRDCHISAINACVLSGANPIYVSSNIHKEFQIPTNINIDEIKNILKENNDIKAIFITSPNYYGFISDIKKIREIAKDIPIIVDEAHGAHLGLSEKLPQNAIELGADIVIQSTHKTLASFTQSSMMHIKGNRVNIDKIKKILSMLQSSSPSYMLMSSLDMSTAIYESYGYDLMSDLLSYIDDLHKYIGLLNNIDILRNDDSTKIYISTKKLAISGYDVEKILREKYKIQVELSNHCGVLLVSSIGNEKEDFEKLKEALKDINDLKGNYKFKESINYPKMPVKKLTPKEAFECEIEIVNIKESINRICAESIVPYPPGISIISPGEIINEEIINFVLNSKQDGMKVTGLKDLTLNTIITVKE